MTRNYHPYGASDKNGLLVTWFTLKSRVCSKSKEFTSGNLLGSAVALTGNGGALLGCSYWQVCKDAAASRCKEYEVVAILGLMSMLFQAVAGILAFIIPVQFAQEKAKENRKKKKKMKGAKQTTMIVAIFAYLTSVVGFFLWTGYMESMITSFNKAGSYPSADAYAGSVMALIANVFVLIGTFITIFRFLTFSTKKETEDDDEGQDSLPPPPPGFGAGAPPPPPGALPPPPGAAPLPPGVPPPPVLAGIGGGPPGE